MSSCDTGFEFVDHREKSRSFETFRKPIFHDEQFINGRCCQRLALSHEWISASIAGPVAIRRLVAMALGRKGVR